MLEVDALTRQAERLTGLDDWGDQRFTEPLALLLASLRQASLAPRGVERSEAMVLRALVNRLRIREALKRDPSVEQRELGEVVIIAGLPRTGATHLLDLLATDPANRVLRLFELLNPAGLVDGEGRDARRADAAAWVTEYYRLAPGVTNTHRMTGDGPNECHHLFSNTFETPIFSFRSDVAAYSEWLAGRDPTPAYREYRTMLSLLLGQAPRPQRLVVKDCFHPWRLRALLDVFPTAKIIQMHRDPLEVLPAWCSMSRMVRSMVSDAVEPAQLGAHWSREMVRATDSIVALRSDPAIDRRFFDIRLVDFRPDPIGQIERFYQWAGYESSHVRTTIVDERVAGKRHEYSLEMFSLDRAEHERRFASYKERFQC